MSVREEDNNYICPKHNQVIQVIVMDKSIQPIDQLFCQTCLKLHRQPLQNVLHLDQAIEMIREKLSQSTEGLKEAITTQLSILKNLQSKMIELQQSLLLDIQTITKMVEQWSYELSKSIKENEYIDLIKGLQLLQCGQEQSYNKTIEQNNIRWIGKIDSAFKKLLTFDGIQKCYDDLKKIEINYQYVSSPIKYSQIEIGPISYQKVNQQKQEEVSQAMAFNTSGSIMVAGSQKDIKVWQFQKGSMTQLATLKGSNGLIKCLLFSRKNQWFVSGDYSGNIISWKQGKNKQEWLSNQAQQKHSGLITCMILTQNEDYLLSSSDDKTIIVWNVNQEPNKLVCFSILANKHNSYVNGLSLNFQETVLVSCGWDKQLILWIKGQPGKWIFKCSVTLDHGLLRVNFFSENKIIVQQSGKAFTNIFEIQNYQLNELEDSKISLNDPKDDSDSLLFPTIYNQSKELIIQKAHEYIYFFRKQTNGQLKLESKPIDCKTKENYGTLTPDGEYLIIWSTISKEFSIYKLSYG